MLQVFMVNVCVSVCEVAAYWR